MFFFWLILAAVAVWAAFSILALVRAKTPMEPALTPGDLGAARDPEFFDLQRQIMSEHGCMPAGDFVWHEGLVTICMRLFVEKTGKSYGWAVEEALAGRDGARRAVSVLTEFTDGTLLDTTSGGSTSLAIPGWFLREAVAPDTELLLRRHAERVAAAVAAGKEIKPAAQASLIDTVRRNERRLSEYQVEAGRMRLVDGYLHLKISSAVGALLRGLGRILIGPFRRGRG